MARSSEFVEDFFYSSTIMVREPRRLTMDMMNVADFHGWVKDWRVYKEQGGLLRVYQVVDEEVGNCFMIPTGPESDSVQYGDNLEGPAGHVLDDEWYDENKVAWDRNLWTPSRPRETTVTGGNMPSEGTIFHGSTAVGNKTIVEEPTGGKHVDESMDIAREVKMERIEISTPIPSRIIDTSGPRGSVPIVSKQVEDRAVRTLQERRARNLLRLDNMYINTLGAALMYRTWEEAMAALSRIPPLKQLELANIGKYISAWSMHEYYFPTMSVHLESRACKEFMRGIQIRPLYNAIDAMVPEKERTLRVLQRTLMATGREIVRDRNRVQMYHGGSPSVHVGSGNPSSDGTRPPKRRDGDRGRHHPATPKQGGRSESVSTSMVSSPKIVPSAAKVQTPITASNHGKSSPSAAKHDNTRPTRSNAGCWNCGKMGHTQTSCTEPRKQQASSGNHMIRSSDTGLENVEILAKIGRLATDQVLTRVLLDSGSDLNLINKKLVDKFPMMFPGVWREPVTIRTVAGSIRAENKLSTAVTFQLDGRPDVICHIEASVIDMSSFEFDAIISGRTLEQHGLLAELLMCYSSSVQSHVVNTVVEQSYEPEPEGSGDSIVDTHVYVEHVVCSSNPEEPEMVEAIDGTKAYCMVCAKDQLVIEDPWNTVGEDAVVSDDISIGNMIPVGTEVTNEELNATILAEDDQFKVKIFDILRSHRDTFSPVLPIGGAKIPFMDINLLPGAEMPQVPMRRYGAQVSMQVESEVRTLLEQGIIVPSSSSVVSPTVVVTKPDKSMRLCVGYVKLNSGTVPLLFPMPSIPALLESVQGMKYFAKLDLRQSYYQCGLVESCRYLTAFRVQSGLYEFTRIPFGLRNAPPYFQQQMQVILSPHLHRQCLVFVDDTTIFGHDKESFIKALDDVLTTLERHCIRVKLSKCSFGSNGVKFLGFDVDQHGYSLDEAHRRVVGEMKPPSDRKVLRSFLGLASYHRQFVPNYVNMTAPLSELMKKQNPWLWTGVHLEAFNKVVAAIVESGKLYHIDYNLALFVRTDASIIGVGGMLYQIRSGVKEVIAYVAKKFTEAERRWSTIEQECYAVYYAIIHWEGLLLGQRFTVETDHANLQFLNNTTTPKCVRWRTRLQEFTFALVHIPGSDNQVADALSRCLVVCSSKSVDDEISLVHNSIIGHHGVVRTMNMLKAKNVRINQMKEEVTTFIASCPLCQKIRLGQGSMDAALHSSMVSTPGEVWCIDTMGPYPEDELGMLYIVVCIDAFTRYAVLYPTKDKTAKAFMTCMISLIGHFGFMKEIRTDNAGQFTSKEVNDMLLMFKVEHQLTIPFRHQANGLVERTNREVGRHLQALVAQASRFNSWSTLVPLVQRIINMSYNKNIGTNPARLVYGDSWNTAHDNLYPGLPVVDGELVFEQQIENLNENIQMLVSTAQSVQEKEIELRLHDSPEKPTIFLEGAYVLVDSDARDGPVSKLNTKWLGPYIIVEVLSDGNNLRVQHLHTRALMNVHITMVKSFDDSHIRDLTADETHKLLRAFAAMDVGENVIEAIVDHHVYGKRSKRCRDPTKVQFQIKWVGDPELTWHDFHEVRDSEALSVYLALHPELRF